MRANNDTNSAAALGISPEGNGAMESTARNPQLPSPPQEESAWAFLGFAWRRKWIIVLIILVAAGLGYLRFQQLAPVYQSSAQLLIVRKASVLPVMGIKEDIGYDHTLDVVFRSPKIINKAVERLDLDQLPSLKSSGNPVSRIIQGLGSTSSGGKNGDIVRFTYRSEDQGECPKVLQAVMDVYIEFLGESRRNLYQETIDLISQAKDQLGGEMTKLAADYREFRDEAPLVWHAVAGTDSRGAAGTNPHEQRLIQIDGMRSVVVLENYETQAKIDGIEAALERGASREALNLMIGHVSASEVGNNTATNTKNQLLPMMIEEQLLLGKYGPDHPEVKVIRKRIELTRQHLLGSAPDEGSGAPTDFYQVYLNSLREQIKLGERKIETYNEQYEKERDLSKKQTTYQTQDEAFRAEIDRKERLYDATIKRLEEISFVEEVNEPNILKTEILNPPSSASQVEPDLKKTMTTAVLLGLLAGIGLAFIVDTADKRFRSPEEIQQQLALPVVGHIPVIRPDRKHAKTEAEDDSGLDRSLIAHFSPQGRTAEAYRAVRTALFFSTQGGGHKVIQVTSPHAGDGKTTLAANLAICIAQSGKKTLLLEADFRRPRCHKIFGLDDSRGVSGAIAGDEEIADVIQDTGLDNLSAVTCGPRPDNPAELLTSPKFEELLNVVSEKFDLVIVDSPPLLAVTDPSAVAARVDGVLLVMRLTKSARKAGKRAREVLDSLGANVIGVVVNGVGRGAGYGYGYGYGRYRYGSGYGYGSGSGDGYGYGYGYGYGRNDYTDKKYYREDGKKQKKLTKEKDVKQT